MRLKILLLLYVFVWPVISCAQSTNAQTNPQDKQVPLFRFQDEARLFGYTDAMGKVIIKPQFLMAEDFSEGLARVETCTDYGLREGYINTTGEFAIPPRFDWAEDFSDGLAEVVIDRKWAFIDQRGTVVIKPEYEADILQHFKFSEGLAAIEIDSKWGYIDKSGQFAIKPQFDQAGPFSEGLAVVERDHKEGYINPAGKIVIKYQFDLAVEFSEGLARVNVGWTFGLNSTVPGFNAGKWGFIDRFGNVVITPQFDFADSFYQGRALVRVNGLCGFIDKLGHAAIDIKYQDAWEFSEGLASVRLDGKWGYIDRDGKTSIPFQFDSASSFGNGVAVVNNSRNRINRNGEIIWTDPDQRRSYSTRTSECEAKIKPPPPTPEEIAQRRKLINEEMLKGHNEHDGALELLYIGDITSVPALLRVLKDNQPAKTANGHGLVICTYAHAVGALERITSYKAFDYQDWIQWWEDYQKSHPK